MRFLLFAFLLFATLGCQRNTKERVIVLGIDGADPVLLKRFMAQGDLPNFSKLAELGDFRELATSNPPQSPVAWATFTTGLDPGGHGIFDFIHRDPKTMKLVPSLGKVDESGRSVLLREGKPFWAYLTDVGVPATLLKVAANFPPDGLPGKVLTGMGTPDLTGSYGTFTYYTSAPESAPDDLSGGRFVQVEERDKLIRASLVGPGEDTLALEVSRNKESALIVAGEQRLVLNQGEWSDWVPLSFETADGMVRFFLKACQPDLKLYASPVNIDPCSPVQAVSSPDSFSRHLCRCCGRFYTQGMPEDTKALVHGVLDDGEFLQQSALVQQERQKLLTQGLAEFQGGLFFFYLSSTDIVSHTFWNATDPDHLGFRQDRATDHLEAIKDTYVEADRLLGQILAASDENTTVLVISDHGFAPFSRAFGLNAWLKDNGYLGVDNSGSETDWSKTKAYGAGFNGLYLNLQGREVQGQVPETDQEALIEELSQKLLQIEDPKTGKPVIRNVYRASEVYSGDFLARGPDLVVGYDRGYRASWQTVLGDSSGDILTDNLDVWSGDHLMDPEVVPGIVLCNKKLKSGEADLKDIAPTILAKFGIPVPKTMRGRNLFQNGD